MTISNEGDKMATLDDRCHQNKFILHFTFFYYFYDKTLNMHGYIYRYFLLLFIYTTQSTYRQFSAKTEDQLSIPNPNV